MANEDNVPQDPQDESISEEDLSQVAGGLEQGITGVVGEAARVGEAVF